MSALKLDGRGLPKIVSDSLCGPFAEEELTLNAQSKVFAVIKHSLNVLYRGTGENRMTSGSRSSPKTPASSKFLLVCLSIPIFLGNSNIDN